MSGVPDPDRDEAQAAYFDMLADIGMTKHHGSLTATEMLAKRCHVGSGSRVLDVGCGFGLTPCYLARTYGCRVVGVDLTRRMVVRAQVEARRRGVSDRVSFCAADAQALPFGGGSFDAVIVESVNIFVPNRALGFEEYARVTAPGGYVGITESTWLEAPTEDLVRLMAGVGGMPLRAAEWVSCLEWAGLVDVAAHSQRIDVADEARGRLKRYGWRSLLGALFGVVRVMLVSRRSRRLIGRATASVPRHALEMMGYGVYVGRKPSGGDASA